jgi:transcriptional regulator with XRE-family HTH domain
MRQIANNLKRLRRSAGYTLKELARRSGLDRNSVSNIEQCRCSVDLATIESLAKGLARQPHELLLPTHQDKYTSVRQVPKRWAIARPPVLSEAALAYAKKIVSNQKLAIAFLKRAGFIDRPGKLARHYR